MRLATTLRLVGWLALTLAAPVAGAQGATALAQFNHGSRFDDRVYELNTATQRMSTILLDATVPGPIGENTFFVRFFSGAFVDAQGVETGQHTRIYGEWTTRLSLLSRARRRSTTARVRDVFIAGQLNRGGTGFRADLIGVGAKLRGPAGLLTTSSVYFRRTDGDVNALKARTSWYLPLHVSAMAFSFEGSADFVSASSTGPDVSAMPVVLVDVSPLFRAPRGSLGVGTEWFLHRTRGARLSAPQLIARWSF
ncbi:MAG: hypothetical protein IT355_06605 [Gemmatimonadaceae bacterium]|nr:hypothetical protein [Gemmatimonadaceae bacterium]